MTQSSEPEGQRVRWLLGELEKQTSGRLSEEARQGLLDEVVSHLDAAIRARLELGMSPIEAEKESVESFGPPSAYIDDLLGIYAQAARRGFPKLLSAKGDRKTMVAFWAITLAPMACLLSGLFKYEMKAIWILFAILGPTYAVLSFKARRIQALPILFASCVAYLVFALSLTFMWSNLYNYDGRGLLPKWQANALKQEELGIVAGLNRLIPPLQHGVDLHRGHLTLSDLARLSPEDKRTMMSAPIAISIPFQDGYSQQLRNWVPTPESRIVFQPVTDLAAATKAWMGYGRKLLNELDERKTDDESEAAALTKAEAAEPWAEFRLNLSQNIAVLPAWFALTAMLNAASGTLGWFLALPMFPRRRTVA